MKYRWGGCVVGLALLASCATIGQVIQPPRLSIASGQTAELGRCVELLQQAEKTVEERTQWALSLDERRTQLAAAVSASRWHRLGRALGLGPELKQR